MKKMLPSNKGQLTWLSWTQAPFWKYLKNYEFIKTILMNQMSLKACADMKREHWKIFTKTQTMFFNPSELQNTA